MRVASTDSKAGARYKAAAQGLITLATYGLGMLVGYSIAGWVDDRYVSGGLHEWRDIWLYPVIFAAIVFAFFAASFRNETVAYARTA